MQHSKGITVGTYIIKTKKGLPICESYVERGEAI